jgi:CHASE3 domain sensor protein
MAMPIFWRLICGYLVILLISLSISSYSIVQLGELSSSAHSALNRDNRMIGYQEKLTDVFLSEVRYAGKFIITHSQPLHDQLRQFKGDFVRYMDEVKTLAESPDIKARLDRVEEFHVRYHELFDQEVKYIKARQPYAETRYREEKEKVLEKLLGELGNLKAHLQNQLQTKLGSIASAGQTARRIAIATTIALLGFGVALAFVISKSIVIPLSELRRTTENIEGDLDYGAKFSRLPEIHDVAVALHNARQRLQEAARTNASFVHSLTDRFATPLVSINKRLTYLKDELSPIMSAEQAKHIEILAAEIERLIDRFSRLPEVPKVALPVANPERPNVYEPRAAARRTFAPIARFVRRAQSKIIAVVTRARELSIGSWNIVRDCIAAGIWKGEKR